jgi:hypothetical protein
MYTNIYKKILADVSLPQITIHIAVQFYATEHFCLLPYAAVYLSRSYSEKYGASSHQGKFHLLHSPIHVHINSTNSGNE